LSCWRLPQSDALSIDGPLRAFAFDIEGRYRIRPGLYAAIRVDRLNFSEVCGSAACLPWDAPVQRVEAGGGYSFRRNLVVKAVYQYNWRDTTVHRTLGLASAQLVVWF
jgi:predicted porin